MNRAVTFSERKNSKMANMNLKKNEMPLQDAKVRARNFDEVALGYTEEQAIDEANRCLNCKNSHSRIYWKDQGRRF